MAEINTMDYGAEEVKSITIRWDKFVDGVGMVFAGAHLMLEALDASLVSDMLTGNHLVGTDISTGEVQDTAGAYEIGTVPDISKDKVADITDRAVRPAAADTAAKEKTSSKEDTPGVSQDDITKIIVQKLKKNRSNNEKIGAILKTYGVAKVSELPPERYEAFLTELSQL